MLLVPFKGVCKGVETLSRPRQLVPAEVTRDDALPPYLVPRSYIVVLFVVDFAEAQARFLSTRRL